LSVRATVPLADVTIEAGRVTEEPRLVHVPLRIWTP
jgi:hypothetical protein